MQNCSESKKDISTVLIFVSDTDSPQVKHWK